MFRSPSVGVPFGAANPAVVTPLDEGMDEGLATASEARIGVGECELGEDMCAIVVVLVSDVKTPRPMTVNTVSLCSSKRTAWSTAGSVTNARTNLDVSFAGSATLYTLPTPVTTGLTAVASPLEVGVWPMQGTKATVVASESWNEMGESGTCR